MRQNDSLADGFNASSQTPPPPISAPSPSFFCFFTASMLNLCSPLSPRLFSLLFSQFSPVVADTCCQCDLSHMLPIIE